jgi:hypothetical protein
VRSPIPSGSPINFPAYSQGKIWGWLTGHRIPPGLLRKVSMGVNPVWSLSPNFSQRKFWGWSKGRSQWIFLNLPVLKGNLSA